ncbi:MAG: SPASM domain-containing protein [Candidatus Aenigmarchaeota archaeon]|nr:SPASM domain-containing protein [Candidatus Aenigmarchaeota archaeon]
MKNALNQLKLQIAYYHRKSYVNAMPKVFGIELNNVCNLRCRFCPYKIMKRKKEFMPFNLFKKIIDEAEGTNFVYLHDFGEPLLHPKLVQFINYADNKNIKVGISTNCTMLTPDKSDALLKTNLYLIILCIDGITKATYEKLRIGGNYEKVVRNVEYFLTRRSLLHHKCRANVQIIASEYTKKETDAFVKLWKTKYPSIEAGIKPFDTVGGVIEKSGDNTIDKELKHEKRYPCRWLWHQVQILSNGDVTLCCRDYDGKAVIGNIKKNSLKEIWNSNKMIEERNRQKNGQYNELCIKCYEWIGEKQDNMYPFSMSFVKDVKKFKRGVD